MWKKLEKSSIRNQPNTTLNWIFRVFRLSPIFRSKQFKICGVSDKTINTKVVALEFLYKFGIGQISSVVHVLRETTSWSSSNLRLKVELLKLKLQSSLNPNPLRISSSLQNKYSISLIPLPLFYWLNFKCSSKIGRKDQLKIDKNSEAILKFLYQAETWSSEPVISKSLEN